MRQECFLQWSVGDHIKDGAVKESPSDPIRLLLLGLGALLNHQRHGGTDRKEDK